VTKKDLYRFAKARRDKRVELFKLSADEIKMIEHNYYSKFNTKIITQVTKKDLYRFAKARKKKRVELFKLNSEEIKMIEYNYYSKFNTNYFG
jgi:hypothetical protein